VSPLLLKFALEFASRKAKENQEGLKLSETRHYLVCVDHVHLMINQISAMKINTLHTDKW
jgi:hypothetical protein